jgi:hypothetical protein
MKTILQPEKVWLNNHPLNILQTNQRYIMTSISIINHPQKKHHSLDEPLKQTNWTSAKIKQFAIYAFAAILAFAILAACLIVPSNFTLTPIPISLGVFGLAHAANRIKDYEDPKKLRIYKEQSAHMSFQQLHEEFGLTNTSKYLLSTQELKEKFNSQIQQMDFSSIVKSYDLDELSKIGVTTPNHIKFLKYLKQEEKESRNKLNLSIKGSSNDKQKSIARNLFHQEVNLLERAYDSYKKTLNLA